MATAKKPRVLKKQTIRQKMDAPKGNKRESGVAFIKRRVALFISLLKKEIYLPLPENKTGKFLNKKRSFTPKFLRNAWAELRQVTWPSRKETWKLTTSVFLFAIIFGLIVALTDYGLDKIFKKVILK